MLRRAPKDDTSAKDRLPLHEDPWLVRLTAEAFSPYLSSIDHGTCR